MPMNHHAATGCGCDDCRPHSLARNNYFTGKLMCERDFTDEQWFFREKIRLHHQRLHGRGIVCGLQVRQHPNASCRDRLVLIEPGSAIDCCGHDILVAEQEVFDFTQNPAVKSLIQAKDIALHTLEFCLVWRECPTEEVPILYDECGCDHSQCAPNRILESYAIEVRVDPPRKAAHGVLSRFDWGPSIGIAHANAAALDETGQRVFVAAGTGAQTALYQVDTQHLLTESSTVLGRTLLDLAIAPDGHTLYVAVAPTSSDKPPELWVFTPDAAGGIATGAARTAPLGTAAADTAIALSVTGDGRLLAVGTTTGNLWLFPAGVADPTSPTATGTLGGKRSAAAFSSDGKTAWLGESGNASVDAVDLTAATLTAKPVAVAVGSADTVALVSSGSGPDQLAVLDQAAPSLFLVDPAAAKIIGTTTLNDPPEAVLITPGGGTAIVLSGKALQAVNLVALAAGQSNPAGPDYPLQATIGQTAMTTAGNRLFVPFSGDPTQPASGGVAIVQFADADCRDALRGHECPGCDAPDCLVLATVSGWQVGCSLQDPPADAASDPAASIARIDNDSRTVLASTQAIARALHCLLDQRSTPTADVPAAKMPQPNVPAAKNLTNISNVSWAHAQPNVFPKAANAALGLAFDGKVNSSDLTQPSALMVLVSHYEAVGKANYLQCWRQLPAAQLDFASANPAGPIPTEGWGSAARRADVHRRADHPCARGRCSKRSPRQRMPRSPFTFGSF